MEFNYYAYNKPECNISIDKIPKWYQEIEYQGDESQGSINFNSQNDYDEIWGPNSTLELTWEKKGRSDLFYYKEVQGSIDVYNAIGIVVTEKKKDWLMSHEFTYWFGHRNKMIRRRYYNERVIHGIFYCEISERVFNIHTIIIGEMYENFKPYVLKSYSSIICH